MKQLRKLFPLKLAIVLLLITCFCTRASAQTGFYCSKLLKQNIVPEKSQDIVDNFTGHAECFGLDSIDLKVFGNGPALGVLLVKRAQSGDKTITYADLLSDINKAKSDTSYSSLRNLIVAQNILESTKISLASWEGSVKYLKIIGMPDSEMEPFHQYLIEKKDKNWNYRQLVVAYQMKKQTDAPAKQ